MKKKENNYTNYKTEKMINQGEKNQYYQFKVKLRYIKEMDLI